MSENLPWFLTHSNPKEVYTEGRFLVVDFETTELDNGSPLTENNDIVLAAWQIVESDGTVSKYGETFGGIFEQQELLDDIASVDFIVAQNLKFELGWLHRCGADLHDILGYDTMLAAWVMDGNQKKPRDLGSLAKRFRLRGKVDLVSLLIKLGVPTRDIHPAWLLEYCHQDVEATKNIFLKQQALLTQRKQWHLVHTRNLTCSVLADIEFEGLDLDNERVQKEYTKAVALKEDMATQLAELTGGINLNSPKQLAIYLYDTLKFSRPKDHRGEVIKTGKGADATSAPILEKLKAVTEDQEKFLKLYKDYNKQSSLLSKNLEYFKLTCDQKGGRFYGLLKQGVVQTHRLASSGIAILFKGLKKTKTVQLQNIPREFKRLFWSGDEDWEVFEADGAQLEFRVATELGKDKVGLAEIEGGVDVHQFTAQVLYENGDPEISNIKDKKERRQQSKKHTFRPLFGGGSGSKALVAYCEYFKDKYKGISKTQRDWAVHTADKKQFTTPYGMIFYFPKCKMQRSGYITESTMIYNYPIQGFATGEIIPIAMVYFWHRTKGKKIKLFVTVHDSLVARVHKDSIEEATQIAKQSLTYDVYEYLERVYHYKFRVPLGLGVKHSRNWGDTHEEYKLDVWNDGREVER